MSQFMARYLAERDLTLDQFKKTIKDKDDRTIRHFLSGDLRLALLDELQTARDTGGRVFAALFELSDDELIGALCTLRDRAGVVLANGSVQAELPHVTPCRTSFGRLSTRRPALLSRSSATKESNRTSSALVLHVPPGQRPGRRQPHLRPVEQRRPAVGRVPHPARPIPLAELLHRRPQFCVPAV